VPHPLICIFHLCPPLNLFNMIQSLSMLTFMLSSKSAQFLGYMDLRTSTIMVTCHTAGVWRLLRVTRRQCTGAQGMRDNQAAARETPAFISSDLWPPNSPDLNPVDYKIWGVMQDRVYHKKSDGRERVERASLSDWLRSGPDCNRTWLTVPSTSGTDACMPAFGLEEDILSICCDCISALAT